MTNPIGSNAAPVQFTTNFITGMQVQWASTTTLSISAGSCRDSTDTTNMTAAAVTLNAATNGLGGLDTGSLAASTKYYVYAIDDSMGGNAGGFILSASATTPVLTNVLNGEKYDSIRLIDYQKTDGSSLLLKNYNTGLGNLRTKYWDTVIALTPASAGAATALASIGDLTTAAVPAVDNTAVILNVEFTPATAGHKVSFAPGGSSATVLTHLTGNVASQVVTGQFKILSKLVSSVPTINYINSNSSGLTAAWVSGFEYLI